MTTTPSERALRWAAETIGIGAKVLSVTGMHEGSSPWRLLVERDGVTHDVVLRVAGWIWPQGIATGAAALRFAEECGLSAPRLIATDLDGRAAGAPATLETALPGSSEVPPRVSIERLREGGAAIAKVHAVRFDPRPDLPLRIRPTSADDHALDRRWATLYRASTDSERPAVLDGLSVLTGCSTDRALQVVQSTHSTSLLQLADDRIRATDRPARPTVFVHGDIWCGNMRWDGDRCTALIDWKDAGAGDPGVDVGQLRMQMAVQYGLRAEEHVLAGWQRESGCEPANVPYWDAVAALNTPAVMAGWPAFEDGRPLDTAAVTERRDAFLRSALDRLQSDPLS